MGPKCLPSSWASSADVRTLFTVHPPGTGAEQPGLGTWSWGGHAPPSPPLLLSHPEPPPFTPRSVMNRLCDLRSLYFVLSCASVFSSAKWETNSDLAGTLGGSYEKKKSMRMFEHSACLLVGRPTRPDRLHKQLCPT